MWRMAQELGSSETAPRVSPGGGFNLTSQPAAWTEHRALGLAPPAPVDATTAPTERAARPPATGPGRCARPVASGLGPTWRPLWAVRGGAENRPREAPARDQSSRTHGWELCHLPLNRLSGVWEDKERRGTGGQRGGTEGEKVRGRKPERIQEQGGREIGGREAMQVRPQGHSPSLPLEWGLWQLGQEEVERGGVGAGERGLQPSAREDNPPGHHGPTEGRSADPHPHTSSEVSSQDLTVFRVRAWPQRRNRPCGPGLGTTAPARPRALGSAAGWGGADRSKMGTSMEECRMGLSAGRRGLQGAPVSDSAAQGLVEGVAGGGGRRGTEAWGLNCTSAGSPCILSGKEKANNSHSPPPKSRTGQEPAAPRAPGMQWGSKLPSGFVNKESARSPRGWRRGSHRPGSSSQHTYPGAEGPVLREGALRIPGSGGSGTVEGRRGGTCILCSPCYRRGPASLESLGGICGLAPRFLNRTSPSH